MADKQPFNVMASLTRAPNRLPSRAMMVVLLLLSFFGTYIGISEYISANFGVLPLEYAALVALVVAALTGIMAYAIDRALGPDTALVARPLWFLLYVGMAGISIGFGFAFWWAAMEARHATNAAIAVDVDRVESNLTDAVSRLGAVEASLAKLATESASLSTRESSEGGTCGDGSAQGFGPRTRLRADHAKLFAGSASDLTARLAPVRTGIATQLAQIRQANSTVIRSDKEARLRVLGGVRADLNKLIADYNRLREDSALRSSAESFKEFAGKYDQRDGWTDKASGEIFTCADSNTARLLRAASEDIQKLKPLENANFRIFEGSEAALEAFNRLSATFGRVLSGKGVVTPAGEVGLSERDWLPFSISVLVDLGVLALSLDKPKPPGNRKRPGEVRLRGRSERARATADRTQALAWLKHENVGLGDFVVKWDGRDWLAVPEAHSIVDEDLRIAVNGVRQQAEDAATEGILERWISGNGGGWQRRARKLLGESPTSAHYAGPDMKNYAWFKFRRDGVIDLARTVYALEMARNGARDVPQLVIAEDPELRLERDRERALKAARASEDAKTTQLAVTHVQQDGDLERQTLEAQRSRQSHDRKLEAVRARNEVAKRNLDIAAEIGAAEAKEEAIEEIRTRARQLESQRLARRAAESLNEINKLDLEIAGLEAKARDLKAQADRQRSGASDPKDRGDEADFYFSDQSGQAKQQDRAQSAHATRNASSPRRKRRWWNFFAWLWPFGSATRQ